MYGAGEIHDLARICPHTAETLWVISKASLSSVTINTRIYHTISGLPQLSMLQLLRLFLIVPLNAGSLWL